ncbi:MAG: nitrous oxide reductase family maturation protein NosD [Saprospiraceae bacterium]|nr:nitrous oxide reductase family maturation protein NosD [Saprospiraceae bacterium]HQW96399.1 nitrous oxide reductase family maturation protein NosD [Saprospiraceae bacterium]
MFNFFLNCNIHVWVGALLILLPNLSHAAVLEVGKGKQYQTIQKALESSKPYDTLYIHSGEYKEGNIRITKPLTIIGRNWPIINGEKKVELMTIRSSYVNISGLVLKNSAEGTMNDPAAIRVAEANHISVVNNKMYNNFFAVYLQYAKHCLIKDNVITASQQHEYQSGNGIHCWKSDSLQIIGNRIAGHRDGIYFEFVTHSIIWRNIAENNLRYGLHFMFSNNDTYITNLFRNNGSGVAVMFTKHVTMINNTFTENWGDASYGVLLKEISDCYMSGNKFYRNTTGIFLDGSNRVKIEKNSFKGNGWGMRLQANCMDNVIGQNNFIGNTFDVSTNGSLTLNVFEGNYWDNYEGYDLDKDKTGDLPYRPLSLYSVLVEKNPPAMLLYRSFMVNLLDRSEKIIPSLTPENFIDKTPKIIPYQI